MTDRYYAIDVAAAATGVKPRHIRKWIADNLIAPLITAGVPYVTVEQVEAARTESKRHGYANLARSLTNPET